LDQGPISTSPLLPYAISQAKAVDRAFPDEALEKIKNQVIPVKAPIPDLSRVPHFLKHCIRASGCPERVRNEAAAEDQPAH
jgi:hypothetical protein